MMELRAGFCEGAQEAHAARASEGRWPRICERLYTRTMPEARCAHVL